MSGETHVARVVIDGAADRPDQSDLVHDARQIRQVLADLNTRHTGGNRPELTANFCRRVRLQIDQVDMRGPARQKDHDDRLVRAALGTDRLCPQDIGQRQAAHGQPADLQKRAAGNAVAQTIFLPRNGQHQCAPACRDCRHPGSLDVMTLNGKYRKLGDSCCKSLLPAACLGFRRSGAVCHSRLDGAAPNHLRIPKGSSRRTVRSPTPVPILRGACAVVSLPRVFQNGDGAIASLVSDP